MSSISREVRVVSFASSALIKYSTLLGIEAFSTALRSSSPTTKDVDKVPILSHILLAHFVHVCRVGVFVEFSTVCGINHMLPPLLCVEHPRDITDEAYREHAVDGKSFILTKPSRNADLTPGFRSNVCSRTTSWLLHRDCVNNSSTVAFYGKYLSQYQLDVHHRLSVKATSNSSI